MANVGTNFKKYVKAVLGKSENVPFCPFPKGGECYITDRDTECLNCEYSKESFIEQEMQKKKHRGAKVFCVVCGSSNRVPLRRWDNVYICDECWKIKERVGEEKFIDILKGKDE